MKGYLVMFSANGEITIPVQAIDKEWAERNAYEAFKVMPMQTILEELDLELDEVTECKLEELPVPPVN